MSWVDQGSNAEKAGLKVGDYIHRVNEVGLGLTFVQATQVCDKLNYNDRENKINSDECVSQLDL